MSQIQRPTKQGGATTYQGKVGAGYTTILASEMDADLDTIYSAWNTGVDGSNIRPGVITGGMLAPGAVGSRELADGGIQTVDIGDGQVTQAKLAPTGVSAAPSGPAGGDLGGTYPNPFVSAIQSGGLQLVPRALLATTAGDVSLWGNHPSTSGYDNTRPTWQTKIDYTNDTLEVWRAPAGSTTFVKIFYAQGLDGKLYATLGDGTVGRAALAVNGIYGLAVSMACPAGYTLNAPVGAWVTYMTLPPLTTRGGLVLLHAQHNLSCSAPVGGGTIAQRWNRDGVALQERACLSSTTAYVPLPGVEQFDNPPAGSHTYALQLWLGTSCAVGSPAGSTQGYLDAREIG